MGGEHFAVPPPMKKDDRLTNKDFKTLLMTPRIHRSDDNETHVSEEVQQTPKKRNTEKDEKRRQRKKFFKKKEKEEASELSKAGYRDRAKERREGADPDYKDESPVPQTPGGDRPDRQFDPTFSNKAADKIDIETSKYLGGDLQHTHLVKGLDYALLAKVKSEIAEQEKTKQEEELEKIAEEMDQKPKNKESTEQIEPQVSEFKTFMAKSIFNIVNNQMLNHANLQTHRVDSFLPGRTSYVFNLDPHFSMTDIPTTVIRSKQDCPVFEERLNGGAPDEILGKINKIMTYVKQGTKPKKMRKKVKKESESMAMEIDTPVHQPTPVKQPIQEIDIFDDVTDDYICVPTKKTPAIKKDKEIPTATALARPTITPVTEQNKPNANKYFQNANEETEKQNEPSTESLESATNTISEVNKFLAKEGIQKDRDVFQAPEDHKGMSFGFKKDYEKLDKKEAIKKARQTEGDTYAECYPGTFEDNFMAEYDSEEEADFTKMDMGNKRDKNKLKRWDFDTEEEWSKYNDQREAMPRAAFQFGIKMADGRKTRRTKEQKLNQEFQKINEIMKKRGSKYTLTDEKASKKQKKE